MSYPNRRGGGVAVPGAGGKSVLLERDSDSINWKQTGETEWHELVMLDELMPEAPTISMGEVETLPAGSQATASLSGTAQEMVLNLGLPSGGDGDDAPAPTLSVGTISSLPYGSQPTASISGAAPEFIINLGIPLAKNGDNGPANALSVGTVTSLPAGSAPKVTISGSAPNQVLNFQFPQPATAPPNTLTIGTVGTGAAAATITGTAPNQVLNLTLPQGSNGVTPTFSVGTVSTLLPGSSATVSVSGTAPNYVLNFGLPAGMTGSAPVLGIGSVTTLAAGSAATATISGTAPNYLLNIGIPAGAAGANGVSYSPQAPVARTVTAATAYQHTDTTKPCKVTVNARATQTVTVAGTVADRLELRIGPTAAAVAPSGAGGFSMGVWESGITGIALMIGAAVQDGGQITADLPAGWYFQINRLSGTSATVVNCFTQSLTA